MWTGPFVLHYETGCAGVFGYTEDSARLKYFLDFQAFSCKLLPNISGLFLQANFFWF